VVSCRWTCSPCVLHVPTIPRIRGEDYRLLRSLSSVNIAFVRGNSTAAIPLSYAVVFIARLQNPPRLHASLIRRRERERERERESEVIAPVWRGAARLGAPACIRSQKLFLCPVCRRVYSPLISCKAFRQWRVCVIASHVVAYTAAAFSRLEVVSPSLKLRLPVCKRKNIDWGNFKT
jgi:hypothetical protein